MIDLPPIVAYLTVAVGVALLFFAGVGLAWLVAEWRRAPRDRAALDCWKTGGAEAMRAWNEKRRWNEAGR